MTLNNRGTLLVVKRTISAFVLSVTLGFVAAPPIFADGFAGAYLAARSASAGHDFKSAAQYFTRALMRDASNVSLLDGALFSFVGAGDLDRAIPIARRLQTLKPDDQIANMLMLAEAVKTGEYDTAQELLESGRAVGPLVDGLVMAWVLQANGQMAEALDAFDGVAEQSGLAGFGLYHKAMALAVVGDFEGADEILSGRAGTTLPATRRGVLAHVEILSQLERNADAIELIDATFGNELKTGPVADIRAQLDAGETLPFTTIRDAKDGIAEVFFTVAGALSGEAEFGYTLVYTRLTNYLRSNHVSARIMSAQLLEQLERYELATQSYDLIPDDDPAFLAAELGRAKALRETGDVDAAIAVLEKLSQSHSDQSDVHVRLGDYLRREDRFAEAETAYSAAIDLFDVDQAPWGIYYARGIMFERTDRWDQAEADFRMALQLNPDQPQVLNYLGYSFVEQQTNMDEALDMIKKAVKGRPDDAYITDSLGWVLYRLGRYKEALPHMEKAVELLSVDPVINDHLGDVFWAVGRAREAEFQWYRALSFEPEDVDVKRIRRKLKIGLDVVLEEEGADPIEKPIDG